MIKLGIYKHYKGGKYRVLSFARSSETTEFMVIYESLYSNDKYPEGTLWARPLEEFMDDVDGVMRFKYIGE